jgi:hypothetical protein
MTTLHIDPSKLAAIAMFMADKDVRYYLKGVCLDLSSKGANLVACDGCTMAIYHLSDDPLPDAQFIIPDTTIDQLAKTKGTISLDVSGLSGKHDGVKPRKIEFAAGTNWVACAEVDGIYPDWRRVAVHNGDAWRDAKEPAFFNPDYVMRVHKASIKIQGKRKYPAHIRPAGTGCGFAQLDTIGHVVAYVMPMRGDMSGLPSHPGFSW